MKHIFIDFVFAYTISASADATTEVLQDERSSEGSAEESTTASNMDTTTTFASDWTTTSLDDTETSNCDTSTTEERSKLTTTTNTGSKALPDDLGSINGFFDR